MRVRRAFRSLVFGGVALAAWVACVGEDPSPTCVGMGCVPIDAAIGDGSSVADAGSLDTGLVDAGVDEDAEEGGPDGGDAGAILSVVAGGTNDCVLYRDGTVKCWGDNGTKVLGDTALKQCQSRPCSWEPVTIEGLKAQAVGVGDGFACAIDLGGQVKCWGTNRDGQLGHPPAEDPSTCTDIQGRQVKCNPTPTSIKGVPAGTVFVRLAVGGRHACAASNGGQVRCWGRNAAGELGRGTLSADAGLVTPAVVSDDLTTYVAISASGAGAGNDGHVCGVTGPGGARCWGRATGGALGRPDAGVFEPTPSDVELAPGKPLTAIHSLSTAHEATCALLENGHVSCWGSATYGLVGAGSNIPAVIDVPAAFARLTGRQFHMCAREAKEALGKVWCWGWNTSGQLGDGVIGTDDGGARSFRSVPAALPSFDAVDVSASLGTVALRADGTVWTWGTNLYGLLGRDPGTDSVLCDFGAPCSARPLRVPSLP